MLRAIIGIAEILAILDFRGAAQGLPRHHAT